MQRYLYAVAAALVFGTSSIEAALFIPLGFRSGGTFSKGYGLSADGTTVVGESGGLQRATTWSISGGTVTGVQPLDLLSGGLISTGNAVSANGQFTAGGASPGPTTHATRWNGTTATDLGTLVGPSGNSYANALSNDGSIVVGSSSSSLGSGEAFRWSGGTMTGLGFLNGGSDSGAYGVSDDGAYVVGQSMYNIGGGEEGTTYIEAFVWHGGTMIGLGLLGGGTTSYATAITPDATKIVGVAEDAASNGHVVRWVSDGLGGYTMQDLGQFGMNARANAVSADGNTVVGYSTVGNTFPDDQRAIFWSAGGGMQLLQTVLTNQGVDLTGWTLYDATDISADGTKIVGYGQNTSGQLEAFYAEISAVPEPSTLLTTGGLVAVAWLRRRRRDAKSPAQME